MLSDRPDRPEHYVDRTPDNNSRRGRGRPSISNEQLLEVALDLFLKGGFDQTAVDAIAAAAGMAKRTVYKRYPDKLSLFKAALKHAIDMWIVPIERLRAAECEDLQETLLEVARILVANMMSPQGLRLLRITNVESVRLPELGTYTFNEGTEPTIDYLADLFRRYTGRDERTFPEAEITAEAFMSLVISGPAERAAWGTPIEEAALDRRTRYCVQLFLHGLLRQTSSGGEAGSSAEEAGSNPASCVPNVAAGSVDDRDIGHLEAENGELREMLVNSMLEAASLRRRLNAAETLRSPNR
jgi:TetR/AcrR family transcriptional repressor of mexJK operon